MTDRPIYTQMRCVPGFTKEAIRDYANANIAPGTRVLSDGLACFDGVVEAGMKHTAIVTGGGRPKDSDFKWINTGLGNIKSAITGTCRSCDPQHTDAISPPSSGASIAASSSTRWSSASPASPPEPRPSPIDRSPRSEAQRRHRGNQEGNCMARQTTCPRYPLVSTAEMTKTV